MGRLVRACDPPALAVMVGDTRVPIEPPDMLGVLGRIDLIVEETRCDREGTEVRALMGVPSYQPAPTTLTQNSAVHQVALATVSVKRHQWVIQEGDISALSVSPEEVQPYLGDARPGSWCPCSDSPACEDDMECQENRP